MADLNKFEEMLERLINEDKDGAEELFHEIVVEKSREIYESLLEDEDEVDEASDEEVDESDDEEVDESDDEEVDESDDEEVSEDFDLDEFEVEADPMMAMGGDAADDMMGDVDAGADDMDMDMDMGDEDGEGDIEDRVVDLEDALDDLKAEFEKMMSDEDGDDEGDMDMDMDMGGDDEGEEDEGDDEAEEESVAFESDDEEVDEAAKEKAPKSAGEQMREYVEKVRGGGLDAENIGGDNGQNTKSPVAGKNDMGGTASNLAQGKDNESGDHAGLGELNAKEDSAGNVNVPGAKGATKMGSTSGHGAEKKGKAPEKAGAGSPLNGVSSRAK